MNVEKIHHVAYRCKDAKQTVEWYGKMLNMDFVLAIAEDRVPSTKEPDPYMHIFLDAIEALRQPIETGHTMVARVNAHVDYPSRVQLVAAMNPCRCGYLDDASRACTRAPKCARDYQSKISGPMFDRIDLHVEVPEVASADLALPPPAENSATVAARVAAARAIQGARYRGESDAHGRPVRINAVADGKLLERVAAPDPAGAALLTSAAGQLRLSARGYHRVLKVARTLADLDGRDGITRIHIAEALSYRRIHLGR